MLLRPACCFNFACCFECLMLVSLLLRLAYVCDFCLDNVWSLRCLAPGLKVGAMESSPLCRGLPVWLHLLIREFFSWALDDADYVSRSHQRRNLDVLLCYEGLGKDRLVDECNSASRLQIALSSSLRLILICKQANNFDIRGGLANNGPGELFRHLSR